MIVGIEGTGSQAWKASDMTRSFVRKVLAQSNQSDKFYFIGPSNLGGDGPTIVNGAWSLINSRMRQADSPSIQLVGYSRGAAYCIYLAKLIAEAGLGPRVSHLILFDAVARQAEFAIPDQIPTTVHRCIHAYRNPAGGSRNGFENVGLYVQDPHFTSMKKQMFMASHGGMGGTWYNAKADEGTWGQDTAMSMAVKANGSQAANTLRAMGPGSAGLAVGVFNAPLGAATAAGGKFIGSKAPGIAAQQISDRDQIARMPGTPTMDAAADQAGSRSVGEWMWAHLVDVGVLPGGASSQVDASPAEGKSFVVGTAYPA